MALAVIGNNQHMRNAQVQSDIKQCVEVSVAIAVAKVNKPLSHILRQDNVCRSLVDLLSFDAFLLWL